MLCAVGYNAILSNLCHLDESGSVADATQDTLVVAFEDQRDSSEDIQQDHEKAAIYVAPWLDPHLVKDGSDVGTVKVMSKS